MPVVLQLGSLVTYRRRPWILADREGSLLYLRPLGGGTGSFSRSTWTSSRP